MIIDIKGIVEIKIFLIKVSEINRIVVSENIIKNNPSKNVKNFNFE